MKAITKLIGITLGLVIGSAQLWAGATFSRITEWSDGNTLTASALNAEFDNILNNGTPTGWDDYSVSLSQMRSTADPYPGSVESQATSLAGELERIRYQILQIKNGMQTGQTYWYEDAPTAGVFTIAGSSVGINDTTPDYRFDVEGSVGMTTATVSSMTVTSYFSFPASTNMTHVRAELSGDLSFADADCQLYLCPVNVWTDVYDTLGEMGTTTFTAVSTGYYRVCANLILTASDAVSDEAVGIFVNGTSSSSLSLSGSGTGDLEIVNGGGCTTVSLIAGDLLTIRGYAIGTSAYVDQTITVGLARVFKSHLTIDRLF